MIKGLFNTTVTIKRRSSTGRDSLNNPTYGQPTSGSGWSTLYSNVPARLAFSQKDLLFPGTGERVVPAGRVYIPVGYSVTSEDRILTADGIEYNILGVVPGYSVGAIVDHYEITVQLP